MKKNLLTLTVAVAAAGSSWGQGPAWTPIHIKAADLHIDMPKTPVGTMGNLNAQKSYFYTCDAPEGRFVAGYTPIPPNAQAMMRREIEEDPGSKGILALLASTVAAFAKGGNAHVYGQNVGMDKGLPSEFATLRNGKVSLKMRVYVSSRRLYVFVASSDPDSEDRFFNSVRLPAEASSR